MCLSAVMSIGTFLFGNGTPFVYRTVHISFGGSYFHKAAAFAAHAVCELVTAFAYVKAFAVLIGRCFVFFGNQGNVVLNSFDKLIHTEFRKQAFAAFYAAHSTIRETTEHFGTVSLSISPESSAE